ncbi:hypothetical protein [Nocardioides lentus]|uniref:hypothetical protein n=1 Tax=Nocardioides lentus TaxID=338077 RepID=UPI0031D8F8DD
MHETARDPIDYPTCEGCSHEWHGLVCRAPVVTIARGGRRTDPCGCRPSAGRPHAA